MSRDRRPAASRPVLAFVAGAILAALAWAPWSTTLALAQDPLPIARATVFNGAAPGANTDMLAADLTPGRRGAFRITVAVTTASVFNVSATDGTTTHVWGLNGSVALQAGDVYTFTIGCDPSLSYNFQVETDGVIEVLVVDEIRGGVL